jgi:molecular chaperone DnaK
MGDKLPADLKNEIQTAVDRLKEVNKGTDVAAIKSAITDVEKIFEKLYQQANPQGGQNCDPNCGGCGDDGVVDADYETVD